MDFYPAAISGDVSMVFRRLPQPTALLYKYGTVRIQHNFHSVFHQQIN